MKDFLLTAALCVAVLLGAELVSVKQHASIKIAAMQRDMDNATKHLRWAENIAAAQQVILKKRPYKTRTVYIETP